MWHLFTTVPPPQLYKAAVEEASILFLSAMDMVRQRCECLLDIVMGTKLPCIIKLYDYTVVWCGVVKP